MLIALFPAPLHAQTAGVTAAVLPAKVSLAPGDVATVDLVVTNASAAPVTVIALSVRTPARVVGERLPAPGALGTVGAAAFVRTTFDLRALRGLEDGEVDVLLEVQAPSGKQLLVATLAVTAGKAPQQLDVALLSIPKTLNDRQTARAAIQVTNPTPYVIEDVRVTVVDSEDVHLRPRSPGLARLDPGASDVVPLDIEVDDRVRTGKQQVAVVVTGRVVGGDAVRSSRVANAEVDLTIFGLDAISPFGIGTLFLVPGLVAVAAFLLLARRVYPRTAGLPDTVEFKDPRMMLFVVPAAALLYLVMFLVWGIDLTNAAGTWDAAGLFGSGLLLGAGAWGVLAAVYYQRTDRKQFRLDDTPEKVLERLEARAAGTRLPTPSVEDRSRRYLAEAPGDKIVTCSVIAYRFTEGADAAARAEFATSVSGSDPEEVLTHVREGVATLRWRLPSGVAVLPRGTAPLGSPEPLLVEEER